jgi:hypothetical protein
MTNSEIVGLPLGIEEVVERLEVAERGLHVATVASCDCDHPANISPDKDAHTDTCRYRVLIVAADALADARAAIEAYEQARASTPPPLGV